ncbi:MAG: DUF6671 family protein [Limnohabitans sp.]|jgi:hypothetical protein
MDPLHWQQPIALPTLHGKLAVIAPVLEPATGCTLVHVPAVDTDQFGTFTRDVARSGSQLEAARAKAHAAIAHSGLALAIASEGAFVSDPIAGVIPWNVEVVLLTDTRHGQEIVGMAQGPARAGQGLARTPDELLQLARELGFPEHRLCLRPDHSEDPRVIKGLGSADELLDAFAGALAQSSRQQVFAESDLRAHCNPTRQAMIRRAAEDLRGKMLSACPACGLPGYALSGHRPGRPCRLCASATREPLAHLWSCGTCHHTEERRDGLPRLADPARCDRCNP